MCAGERVAAALDEGEDTAAVGAGDNGWLVDVPDGEQALAIAPMMISMTIARQPQPANCCFFCDTGLPVFVPLL